MSNDDLDRVVPLDELDDFRVSRDDPDPRGWEVVAADGRKIGEVDELLVDTGAMKVRYLDVDLDDEMVAGEHDRHVLVPIGYARLDRDHDRVIVDEITSADLRAIPAYDHGPITRDFETSVRDSWRRDRGDRQRFAAADADGAPSREMRAEAQDDFYSDDSFDETGFWAARRATGLGGALGDIGNDPGYPRDLGGRS
ncbi:PRC-barrel domain-containing protein [Longimicrobium sp.]|uniref:PRC-barrel domain-containing protein n=1 Tax=Longimicrobium sp. TaxID=2029185 RepID=UPI002C0FF342|nr:PRC-barrel domain-containing protein [Longimicrobium sp.]HSU16384.1 PRC-barrel domain-containing protein [Longimicrobium sp.]